MNNNLFLLFFQSELKQLMYLIGLPGAKAINSELLDFVAKNVNLIIFVKLWNFVLNFILSFLYLIGENRAECNKEI